MIIDPSDLEELDDDFVESVLAEEPEELVIDHSGREEEPELQFYDDYELPEGVAGDE